MDTQKTGVQFLYLLPLLSPQPNVTASSSTSYKAPALPVDTEDMVLENSKLEKNNGVCQYFEIQLHMYDIKSDPDAQRGQNHAVYCNISL